MPAQNVAASDFLLNRQSYPAKMMVAPVPSPADLAPLLTAALRVPDHGKLEPWRFVVIPGAAMQRLADLAETCGTARGLDADQIAKGRGQFDRGLLAVAVISSPKPSDKVPAVEQQLSAGAVCLGLVNAATAAGWAACWLSGWPAHDPAFIAPAFQAAPHETVAGIIHIASHGAPAPARPRPDVAALTRWLEA